jgi:uncharacterized protein (TIGR02145 family)
VPTDAEWSTLTTYLGGESNSGGKLKEAGSSHWTSPNYGSTNERNFTALPGGFRNWDSTFRSIGLIGSWWTPTEDIPNTSAFYRMLYNDKGSILRSGLYKVDGFSVRCVKD